MMLKCDMCYDRTSADKRPMCATVCPSQALMYVKPADAPHRRERPVNAFRFGDQVLRTKVRIMLPPDTPELTLDAADYIWNGAV